jgi:methanogenic corrinoid protein MtbC1
MAEQDRHKGALDPAREEFVFLSIKEMIAEFSEQTASSEPADPDNSTDDETVSKPAATAGRVLCLPVNDEADEIAAAMLAQLLELAGRPAVSLPLDPSLQHLTAIVEPARSDVFCISALPPFAFAHARTLSRLLQVRFPRIRIVIGVWGFTGDTELALQRFQPKRPDKLLTSLGDAVAYFAVSTPAAKDRSAAVAAPSV